MLHPTGPMNVIHLSKLGFPRKHGVYVESQVSIILKVFKDFNPSGAQLNVLKGECHEIFDARFSRFQPIRARYSYAEVFSAFGFDFVEIFALEITPLYQ